MRWIRGKAACLHLKATQSVEEEADPRVSGLAMQDDAAGVASESQREYFISRRRIILGSHLWAGMPVRESI